MTPTNKRMAKSKESSTDDRLKTEVCWARGTFITIVEHSLYFLGMK
jgi:hypothetical protein